VLVARYKKDVCPFCKELLFNDDVPAFVAEFVRMVAANVHTGDPNLMAMAIERWQLYEMQHEETPRVLHQVCRLVLEDASFAELLDDGVANTRVWLRNTAGIIFRFQAMHADGHLKGVRGVGWQPPPSTRSAAPAWPRVRLQVSEWGATPTGGPHCCLKLSPHTPRGLLSHSAPSRLNKHLPSALLDGAGGCGCVRACACVRACVRACVSVGAGAGAHSRGPGQGCGGHLQASRGRPSRRHTLAAPLWGLLSRALARVVAAAAATVGAGWGPTRGAPEPLPLAGSRFASAHVLLPGT